MILLGEIRHENMKNTVNSVCQRRRHVAAVSAIHYAIIKFQQFITEQCKYGANEH